MKTLTWITLTMACAAFLSCSAQPSGKTEKLIGGGEDCDLMFAGMPTTLSWRTNIAPANEPGEPMVISGTIYKKDGKTPAPGVVLYLYQTDNKGLYSTAPNQKNAAKHGHLRGWVKSNDRGLYEFTTIRPASYPNSKNAQHIHPIIFEPGKGYYWIDEYQFEDDPLLTAADKARAEKRGGQGVIALQKSKEGMWVGKRNIILGLNVPQY